MVTVEEEEDDSDFDIAPIAPTKEDEGGMAASAFPAAVVDTDEKLAALRAEDDDAGFRESDDAGAYHLIPEHSRLCSRLPTTRAPPLLFEPAARSLAAAGSSFGPVSPSLTNISPRSPSHPFPVPGGGVSCLTVFFFFPGVGKEGHHPPFSHGCRALRSVDVPSQQLLPDGRWNG